MLTSDMRTMTGMEGDRIGEIIMAGVERKDRKREGKEKRGKGRNEGRREDRQ
jgi:hypothetical protein